MFQLSLRTFCKLFDDFRITLDNYPRKKPITFSKTLQKFLFKTLQNIFFKLFGNKTYSFAAIWSYFCSQLSYFHLSETYNEGNNIRIVWEILWQVLLHSITYKWRSTLHEYHRCKYNPEFKEVSRFDFKCRKI